MTQIISFISPKTAGASSVSLNVAALGTTVCTPGKVAYLEIAGWASQQATLGLNHTSDWSDLLAFYNTPEWTPRLLGRGAFRWQFDIFFSPLRAHYPKFSKVQALAWLQLLQQKYEVVVIDINNAAPLEWQQFFLEQSQQVIGVVAADPLSLHAWDSWVEHFDAPEKLSWILNQVPRNQQAFLKQKFANRSAPLLGILTTETIGFWYQIYQAVPIVFQARSRFKKGLVKLLPQIIKS